MTSVTSSYPTPGNTAAAGAAGLTSGTPVDPAQEASDRFLQLLVTQMQNQDPLNPLDNAQVTSQMAQINTVTSLQTLNTAMQNLSSQVVGVQAMQAAALVGHELAYDGNALRVNADQVGDGGFELSAPADEVTVTIKNEADQTVGTVELDHLAGGRHDFSFEVPAIYQGQPLHFEVAATASGSNVSAMPLAYDTVAAVSNFNGTLAIELSGGERIAGDAVWAYL